MSSVVSLRRTLALCRSTVTTTSHSTELWTRNLSASLFLPHVVPTWTLDAELTPPLYQHDKNMSFWRNKHPEGQKPELEVPLTERESGEYDLIVDCALDEPRMFASY
jgi:hypothetical protein